MYATVQTKTKTDEANSYVNADLSPLRQWVCRQLATAVPNNQYVLASNVETTKEFFKIWTGYTQEDLETKWKAEGFTKTNTAGSVYTRKGGGAVTTSCEAFVGKVVKKIKEAGFARGMPAARKPFGTFDLAGLGPYGKGVATTPGWTWYWLKSSNNYPKPGDIFQAGTKVAADRWSFAHVGIITRWFDALVMYDRYGTGRSPGPVDDFGLDASVAELAAVATHAGAPVDLLAMSQAGPVAVALAATRPDLVRRLVFFGTYASAAEVFIRPDLSATLIALVRSHWGLGSKLLADLYRPDLTDAAADHLAAVLRDSADRDVAAGYLAAIYAADVTALLPAVSAPALVLHYRGDRVIPRRGGLQLAEGLPDARLVTLEGRYHLPDVRDLNHIAGTITAFLSGPS